MAGSSAERRSARRHIGRRFALIATAAALGALMIAWRPTPLERLGAVWGDFKVRTAASDRPAPTPGIVVLAIDEASIDAYGRWPWPRSRFGELVRRLAPARVVGLDVTFSEPSAPGEDAALAGAMQDAGNVVAGFFFRTGAGAAGAVPASFADCALPGVDGDVANARLEAYPRVEANIEPIAGAAMSCAPFNNDPDDDGIVRHYPLLAVFDGRVFPTLAVQLTRYATDREPEVRVSARGIERFAAGGQVLEGTQRLRVAYDAPVATVSAKDLLEGRVLASAIADRIVLVGVTEVAVGDIRATPIDPLLPGVYVHAQAVADLLQGTALIERPDLTWLLAALMLAACVAIGGGRRAGRRALLYPLAIGAALGISWFAFRVGRLWIDDLYVLFPGLVLATFQEVEALVRGEANVREMRRALTTYVAPEVVKEVLADPEAMALGGEEREISVLFSDVAGFTGRAERMSPRDLVSLLNELFDPLTKAVFEERGTLDKYIGDAVMAIYNAPARTPDHAARACATALKFLDRIDELNRQLAERGIEPLELGVGINTGRAVVGNMGSSIRFSYTAMGDAVNVASRLEAMTRQYKARIILSEETRRQAGEAFTFRELDKVRPKGRTEAVLIYELLRPEQAALGSEYAKALAEYRAGRFVDAETMFIELAARTHDGPAAAMAARAARYRANPPPSWDGVHKMEEK
jgi:adenylate cyclase